MTENGTWNTCYKCKAPMWIPEALNSAALHARNEIAFYCAYGHRQFYIVGETEAQKLQREVDRLRQRVAEKDDEISYQTRQREQTEKRLSATKGVVTRIKNRVGNGVCPCCNRSFSNLQRHMHVEHPNYAHEERLEVTE